MKRKYEKPMAFEEVFAAENYCTTACYKIACAIHSNPEPSYGYQWKNHSYSNQIMKNNIVIRVEEKSEYGGGANGGNGWMAGGFDWASGSLEPGTTVYWHTTRYHGSRGWNHYGKIEAADSSHPNHS